MLQTTEELAPNRRSGTFYYGGFGVSRLAASGLGNAREQVERLRADLLPISDIIHAIRRGNRVRCRFFADRTSNLPEGRVHL